jgi:aryl-alcohol dehydrogenase-like predicted oxidoreductase
MIQRIALKPDLEVSRIGLGLAHIHLMGQSIRNELIERALEIGITHFDTARLYGDGLSESVLGSVLKNRRKSVSIATKFGLIPDEFVCTLGPAALPARKIRSLLSKLKISPFPRRSYSRETMNKQLSKSLLRLQTDYIDIYHIHEPLADTSLHDDLFEALRLAKSTGKIRYIGVSGAEIDSTLERWGTEIDIIQTAESAWSESRWTPNITHSLFSEAAKQGDGVLPSHEVGELLRKALKRRPDGAVIVQTRAPDRLAQLAEFSANT